MSLIVLIISACLGSAACREYRVPLDADISMLACQMRGQLGVAGWASEHPDRSVKAWRCESADAGLPA